MNDIEQAVEIIGNRRADDRLARKALDFLGQDIPDIFRGERVPVCSTPYVAGGTVAELRFNEEVDAAGGFPVLASYAEDKFTNINELKVNSWRPRISWPKGQVTRQWVVEAGLRKDLASSVGRAETIFGVDVQQYQRQLAQAAILASGKDIPYTTFDLSEWYGRQSARQGLNRSAGAYYPGTMALYAVFGVLYRYDTSRESNISFRRSITEPASDMVFERLGVEPIIIGRPSEKDRLLTNLTNLDTEQIQNMQKYGRIEGQL